MAIQHTNLELLIANIATALMSPPEARFEDDGADLSRHNGPIQWDAYWGHPYRPKYVTTRCTLGIGGLDDRWLINATEVHAWSKLRNDYFVLFPDYTGRDQVKRYLDVSAHLPPDGPPEIDFEVVRKGNGNLASPLELLRLLESAWDELVRYYPNAWTYSAKWFLDPYVIAGGALPHYFADIPWHLAQYLVARYEHPGPLSLPHGFSHAMVVAHQTTDRMYGKEFGCQSEEMDYNRILIGDVATWFRQPSAPPVEEPKPLPTPEEDEMIPVLFTARVQDQRVRAEPNTASNANILGYLRVGMQLTELVGVHCISTTNIWFRFRNIACVDDAGRSIIVPEGVVAYQYGSTTYLTQHT